MKAWKKCDILMLNYKGSEKTFITKLVKLRKNDAKRSLLGAVNMISRDNHNEFYTK